MTTTNIEVTEETDGILTSKNYPWEEFISQILNLDLDILLKGVTAPDAMDMNPNSIWQVLHYVSEEEGKIEDIQPLKGKK